MSNPLRRGSGSGGRTPKSKGQKGRNNKQGGRPSEGTPHENDESPGLGSGIGGSASHGGQVHEESEQEDSAVAVDKTHRPQGQHVADDRGLGKPDIEEMQAKLKQAELELKELRRTAADFTEWRQLFTNLSAIGGRRAEAEQDRKTLSVQDLRYARQVLQSGVNAHVNIIAGADALQAHVRSDGVHPFVRLVVTTLFANVGSGIDVEARMDRRFVMDTSERATDRDGNPRVGVTHQGTADVAYVVADGFALTFSKNVVNHLKAQAELGKVSQVKRLLVQQLLSYLETTGATLQGFLRILYSAAPEVGSSPAQDAERRYRNLTPE